MKRSTTTLGHRGKDRVRKRNMTDANRGHRAKNRVGAAGFWAAVSIAAALLASNLTGAQGGFRLLEATIDDVHAAFASGELTCRALVQGYLDRDRSLRPGRPLAERGPDHQPGRAGAGRRAGRGLRRRRPHGAAPLRAGAAQGPGGDAGDADHLRVGAVRRVRLRPRRDHRRAPGGGGRDHPRQDEHGRVRVALRRLGLRHHPQRLRPGPQPERLVRGAPAPASRPTSGWSGSGRTPADPSAGRPPSIPWSGCGRRCRWSAVSG